MENKVKTSNNKIKPGKCEEKHDGRIEYSIILIHSSLATFVFIFALELNVRGIGFSERGGVEGDNNLLVSNFIIRLVFIEFSQKVY